MQPCPSKYCLTDHFVAALYHCKQQSLWLTYPCNFNVVGIFGQWLLFLMPAVTLQSSWALSSSLNPSGCIVRQSASGEAATKTRPGSIWYESFRPCQYSISLKFWQRCSASSSALYASSCALCRFMSRSDKHFAVLI